MGRDPGMSFVRGYTYQDIVQCSRVVCMRVGSRKLDHGDAEEVRVTKGVSKVGVGTAGMKMIGCTMCCALTATGIISIVVHIYTLLLSS